MPERPRRFLSFFPDVGWGGGGGVMLTFLELANMVDATQDVGWGWGVGVMLTFLELANMVDATQEACKGSITAAGHS